MARKKMRGRSRMKTLKILNEFFKVQILISSVIVLLLCQNTFAEPGYLDFDNLPETKFTCAGKVIGGYYADLETSCQMFHVCTIGQLDEPMDIKFLCLNGTVFDQETRVCERVDEVDCSKSEKFYYLNLELYGNTMVPISEDEAIDDVTTPVSSTTSTTPATTTTTTMKTTTTTIKTTTSTYKPTTTATRSIFMAYNTTNSNGQNVMGYSSSTIHPSQHYHVSSSTFKPIVPNLHHSEQSEDSDIDEDDDYEYEDDDYLTSEHGEETAGAISSQNNKFSNPFIYHHRPVNVPVKNTNLNLNTNKLQSPSSSSTSLQSQTPPAISFQQQQFQNGDTLSVTVTTHSSQFDNKDLNNNNNNYYKNHKISPTVSIPQLQLQTQSRPPQYNLYNFNNPSSTQTPSRRIPLLPNGQHTGLTPPGLQQIPPFRLRAQGFKLPQQHQPQFDGYRRQSPIIPLHLPFENSRNQKELLGFEDNSADDLIDSQKERKDLKRSDMIVSSSTTSSSTVITSTSASSVANNGNESKQKIKRTENLRQNISLSLNHNENNNNNSHNDKSDSINSSKSSSSSISSSISNNNNNNNNNSNSTFSNNNDNNNNNNFDKVLLTPQNRYIPTLPKVIITASASVSDASGKKLNYSVGSVLGGKIKLPPSTYDEYKEDDVALDPFFLDVPKIRPKIKRSLRKSIQRANGHK